MVMIIIGIMSTIAVPNMSAMMKSYRLKSAANDLASTLQLARLTAISQNANSVVTFNSAAQSYSAFSDNGEGGGTINDGTQSGTEPTIKTLSVLNEYSGEITLGTPTFGTTNFFTAQGSSNAAGFILLQNTSGESYQIAIALGGSIKVVKLWAKDKKERKTMPNKEKKIKIGNREQGFTMIEILVAISLLLVGLLAVGQMQVMTMVTNSTANQRTTAITLAQDQMEILRTRPYANVETPPLSNTSGIYTRSWIVETNTPAINMKRVTITVSWQGKQVQLQSIIAAGDV
jgi:type IV pilus assembly protein PilV